MLQSQLNLVDLAGSEGLRHTESVGERRREGANINKSLLALSQVIGALSEKTSEGNRQHINYRDSKLTRILQTSVGGNAQTVVICTISPAASNHSETRSTVEFAARAKRVQNQVKVNLYMNEGDKIRMLLRTRNELRAQYAELTTEPEKLQGRIKDMKCKLF